MRQAALKAYLRAVSERLMFDENSLYPRCRSLVTLLTGIAKGLAVQLETRTFAVDGLRVRSILGLLRCEYRPVSLYVCWVVL